MAYVQANTSNHNGWRPNANAGPQHLIPPGARRGARHFTGSQARLAGLYGLGQASDLADAMAAGMAMNDPLAGTGLTTDSQIGDSGLTAGDLLALGYSGSDIYTLNQTAGAQAIAPINPAASTTPNASAPQAAPGSFLAAGAQLHYTATIAFSALDVSSTQSKLTQVASILSSKWNIGVVNSSSSGGVLSYPTVDLVVQLGTAYGQAADVKSIIDGAFASLSGVSGVPNSQIAVIYNPGSGGTAPGSTFASGISAWLQSNWQLVAAAVFLIAIGPTLVKKIL
jgi:hypothetical protein